MAPTFQVFVRTIRVYCPTDVDDEQGEVIYHHLETLMDGVVHDLTKKIGEYNSNLVVTQED